MKRFCAIIVLFILVCLTAFDSFAQKKNIKAKLHKEEVEGVSREGAAVEIELSNKSIVKEWESTLKTYGKLTKLKGDAYRVTEAVFPGVTGTCIIYAKCYSNSKGYLAWWSIDNGSHVTSNSKHSESKLEEFARQQYINDINEQIKDAEDAVKSAVKIQDKQIDKGQDLEKDISKNGQDKKKLEQELKDNAADLVQLNKDVETNKADQVKAAEEVAKAQKSASEDAIKSAGKAQQKLISKGANLISDISKNGEQKVKLEQELKDNASDLVQLNKDLENNKDDQKKANQEVSKMEKALDVVKSKLNDY